MFTELAVYSSALKQLGNEKEPRTRRKLKLGFSYKRYSTWFKTGKRCCTFNPSQSITQATWKKPFVPQEYWPYSRKARATIKGYTKKKQLWFIGLDCVLHNLYLSETQTPATVKASNRKYLHTCLQALFLFIP